MGLFTTISLRKPHVVSEQPRYTYKFKEEHDGLRKYVFSSESGEVYRFPSVTTVLSGTADNQWLKDWRAKVGDKAADAISHAASSKGTSMHNYLEMLMQGQDFRLATILPTSVKQVVAMCKMLDENLTSYHHTEVPLMSTSLGVAGCSDLVGVWKNKKAIIDYKTSKRKKHEKDILDYFLQSTLYAMMYEEMYPHEDKIDDIVILIAYDDGTVDVFVKDSHAHRQECVDRIKQYKEIQHHG